MKDFCVVGGGISGSTIANLLSSKYTVEIFDKANGLGGRASNRRFGNTGSFEHGLQYYSPKNKNFSKFISVLNKKNILKEWSGSHIDLSLTKKNSIKYIGTKNNNDVCKYLTKKIKINYLSKITNIKYQSGYWTITVNSKHKKKFKNLIVTCPFPQFTALCSKYLKIKSSNLKIKMEPNITIMAVFKGYNNLPISSIAFKDSVIKWAANENSKNRFKSKLSIWTIQSSTKFAKKFINKFKKNKQKTIKIILRKFSELTGLNNKIVFSNIHGWKYAYNIKGSKMSSLWLNHYKIGVCGDWFLGSKAEDAWISANNLFLKIKKNPPKKIGGF